MESENKELIESLKSKNNLDTLNCVYKMISKEYNLDRIMINNINDRASKIILFVGILVGLLTTFGSLLLTDISKNSIFYSFYVRAFILSILFLVVSIIWALYAYKIIEWTYAPVPKTLIQYLDGGESLNFILKKVINGKCKAITDNKSKFKSKIKFINISYFFFLLGLITLLIFIISLFCTNPIF